MPGYAIGQPVMASALMGIALVFTAAGQSQLPCSRPLSESDVVTLLKGKVGTARIAQLVTGCDVSFTLDQRIEREFKEAGAATEIIELFRAKASTANTKKDSQGDAAPSVEVTFWNSIKDEKDPEYFEVYLKRYPNGEFAEIARLKLAAPAEPVQPLKPQTTAEPTQPAMQPTAAAAEPAKPQVAEPGILVEHNHAGFGLEGHPGSWIGDGRDCRGKFIVTAESFRYESSRHTIEVNREAIKKVEYGSHAFRSDWVWLHLSAGRLKNYDFAGPSSIVDELRSKWGISPTWKK